jgi:hypothetical protein
MAVLKAFRDKTRHCCSQIHVTDTDIHVTAKTDYNVQWDGNTAADNSEEQILSRLSSDWPGTHPTWGTILLLLHTRHEKLW